MATDFAPYANLRYLWPQPAPVTSLREGLPPPAALVVIEMFIKGAGVSIQELVSLRAGVGTLTGFVCRHATLPAGADWLDSGSSWSWDDSGLMPTGLAADARGHAYLGDLGSLPTRTNGGILAEATIRHLGGQFGVGGIGAELRAALGDAIQLEFVRIQ